jgi:mitogen-activated protein kinase kinase kinase
LPSNYGAWILIAARGISFVSSALTNKLVVRVTNYFDTQIRIPIPADKVKHLEAQCGVSTPPGNPTSSAFQNHMRAGSVNNKEMTNEQLIGWYGKILEGVKQRYRKLQRLAR